MNFHLDRSPPVNPKITIFPDNRLHSALLHQNHPFLNWNGQPFNGEEICHFAYADSLYLNKK